MKPISRSTFLRFVALAGIGAALPRTSLLAGSTDSLPPTVTGFAPLELSLERWRSLLPRDRYDVLFEEATERPFSSPLDAEKRDGTFVCAACFLPLFDASAKFDSGTGWPSFFQPLSDKVVGTRRDFKLLWPRTEYHCARCGGHQGHVFNDGPPPTGQRWCNNGLALQFVERAKPLPPLRT